MLLAGDTPLVSCIMPTHNRRAFVPRAIRYFLRQDYPNKELVIIDDGSDTVQDLIPANEQIRYSPVHQKVTLGLKRNMACEQARGLLIMHWDDDDWHAPHRIRTQVEAFLREEAEVCGVRKMLFHEPATGRTWLYTYPPDQPRWLAGGSLLYTRDFWARSPFPDVQVGEDTYFIWNHPRERAVTLDDYCFYVAMIHPGNTSPKERTGAYWSPWYGDIREVMGADYAFYSPESQEQVLPQAEPPTYSIIMVACNTLEMTRLSTLKVLQHSRKSDARLIVVDNASTDGTGEWLDLLAQRGDIDLIRNPANTGHGPALEMAWRRTQSPYLVTLDSDACPLDDDWLPRLRARLVDPVKVTGILHHRNYIHPSCLMIERKTLEEFHLSFLDEKDRPSRLDVAERISIELQRHGYRIAGLERTGALRRGSISEPVYLGSEYEGLVYHQWYTTRAAIANGTQVDDVPPDAIERSLQDLFEQFHKEAREITVIAGIRSVSNEPERLRNARACLRALNLQSIARWRYRIVVVEQDSESRLKAELAPFADRYIFAYNPGAYNRGWAFNIGAVEGAGLQGVLCLIDADLLVPPDFLERGLEAIQDGSRAILPYSEVLYLDAASTEQAIRDRQATPLVAQNTHVYRGDRYTTSQGGCVWVAAELYRQIGGHDERFRGWGYEDREFWQRLARTTAIAQLPGCLLHLDHPRPAMNDQWATANHRLLERLQRVPAPSSGIAIGNPNLYKDEAAPRPAQQSVGRREWENWHRWSSGRIEAIVRDEQRVPQHSSARHQLAAIVVGLGNTLLDVGCGPGAMWVHFQPYRSQFSWSGVDATEAMVQTARRLFPDVPVYHADAGSLPFEDGQFDVVLLRHVLEHLPPWLMEQTLAEAMRVACRAVVIDFYVPPLAYGTHRTTRVGENFLETCWTDAEIDLPVQKAGWEVRERVPLSREPHEQDLVWVLVPRQAEEDRPAVKHSEQLKVSIIMPTYRRQHTIYRTVQTICEQTYPNWELIVVDNAGDGNYCFDDPRIGVYCHTAEQSASYARNQGLQYATGDLVCFFDDDDDMFPNYLERIVAAFEAHPQARLVRCGMIVSNGQQNFSYATPECCLRREYATPTWKSIGIIHDQVYFKSIIAAHGWTEARGEIVFIPETLCRANADPYGGQRSGRY